MFQFIGKDLVIKPSLLKIDIVSMVRFVPPIIIGGGSEKKVKIVLKIVLHFIIVEIKTR